MLLCFDFDGVVVDSLDLLLRVTVAAQQQLGLGRPPTLATIENLTFADLADLIGIPPDAREEYCRRIFDLQAQPSETPPAYAGMVPALESLSRRHRIVVITSSDSAAVEQQLAELGLAGAVTQVLGGELNLPKSERIALARERFAASRAETCMTGDAISDIRQGKLAGVRTAAVTWGFQARELLAREEPDWIVDRPEQLVELWGG